MRVNKGLKKSLKSYKRLLTDFYIGKSNNYTTFLCITFLHFSGNWPGKHQFLAY